VAGIRPGDRIVGIMNRPVKSWEDIQAAVQASEGKPLSFRLERDGMPRDVTVTPRRRTVVDFLADERQVWSIGVGPFLSPTVGRVMDGFPAAEAGITVGDRIVAVDGEPVGTFEELARRIHVRAGQEVTLTVERDGERLRVAVTPQAETWQDASGRMVSEGRIGITPEERVLYEGVDPVTALYHATVTTASMSILIIRVLWKMVEGDVSPRTIGGPILMAKMTGEQARQGFDRLVWLTAVISINLAVLNLLPIPILDGGHLFFFVIELLRRRPVSVKIREMAQRVGLVLLVALMIFAFYNDVSRIDWKSLIGW
jgi:regulator of sigma E protease